MLFVQRKKLLLAFIVKAHSKSCTTRKAGIYGNKAKNTVPTLYFRKAYRLETYSQHQ